MLKSDDVDDVCWPDYERSILNLSCSILKYFGVEPLHGTLAEADRELASNPRHVCVILLDGMGMNVLESTLYYKDFLRRNLITDISSVFPPTTTASTTSFLSGQSPIEHGWLGWDVYFGQEDKTVTCFTNTIQDTRIQAAEYNVAKKYLPYKNIIDQINESGNAKANVIFGFQPEFEYDIDKFIAAIKKSCQGDQRTFTYAYWDDPDHTLHVKGTKATETAKCMTELNEKLTYLCQNCKDTTFFITADHGHKDIMNVNLCEDYPEIKEMLVRQTSIEPRAISFFVKPECVKEFPRIFNDHFGSEYKLFTKEEALKNQLFGPGKMNANSTAIGDFIAAAYKGRTIVWNKNSHHFKSHHAGLSKEEMRIPFICYKYKPFHVGLKVYYLIVGIFLLAFLIMIF